jgi:hypothetical protein
MSYDEQLGQQGDGTPMDGQSRRGPLWNLYTIARGAVGRLRAHVRTWPKRYIDQQSALYEARDDS